MSTLAQTAPRVNAQLGATIDAADTGYRFGCEDATEGRDQAPSVYFVADTPAWRAYNEGYREGCIHAAILTGQNRTYAVFDVYVPFQQSTDHYADVLPDYQRDDYVGA